MPAELPKQKRSRGRPALAGAPGVRSMVHLPKDLDDKLRAVGGGSLSVGIIRQSSGLPPLLTEARAKARKRAAARAKKLTLEGDRS